MLITTLACTAGIDACGGSPPPGTDQERVTVGDTTVVRSWGPGVWGDTLTLVEELRLGAVEGRPEEYFGRVSALAVAEDGTLYVTDLHGPVVRVYGRDGTYLGQLGTEGGGPGEYRDPDGGLSVLPDGRILLRDPPNARVNVYSPAGESIDHWRHPGIRTSRPLYVDRLNRSYNLVMTRPGSASGPPQLGLARIGPEGAVIDTLSPPGLGYRDPMVSARDGDQRNSMPVPFTPRYHWTFSPLGYFVHGLSDRYRILLDAPGAPIRLERPGHERAPVHSDEAEAERRAITRNMRNTEPGWSWSGPELPAVKPPFENLIVGLDGRVWVRLHQTARRVSETVRTGDGDESRDTWVEPLLFDVFEPDGTYLGAVRGPETGMSFWASPVMRGENVWAVTWDELDVAYVVRYRVGG